MVDKKPGYREQGKARAGNVKSNFAINPEQMEFERRKVLEQMSNKVDQKKLNNMAAVAATTEPKYFKTINLLKNGNRAEYDSTEGKG